MNIIQFFKNRKKVLGLNARRFARPPAKKAALRIADNKLLAKKVLQKARLPILETLQILKDRQEVQDFNYRDLPHSFVLKPNAGLGGEGIVVVFGRKKNQPDAWVRGDRSLVRTADLQNHCRNIVDGNFSRLGTPDIAFFEERSKINKTLKPYCWRGIPDIRIIVYNLVPIMAMLRLPTKYSGGRANLHIGGIGVGVDLGTGVTTTANWRGQIIEKLPDSRLLLSGIQIPYFQELLHISAQVQAVTGIGYLGVDLALDRDKGPVILEINARPGLSIQLANLTGLAERLERVRGLKINTAARGIRVGQDLFGGEVEEELEEISGRKVLGINEPIKIFSPGKDKSIETMAKIDTGAYRTTICFSLVEKLGLDKIVHHKKVRGVLGEEERPIAQASFVLDRRLVATEVFLADRREMKYDVIVGRRDLKRFLVDPAKNVFMRHKKDD
ncbi:MAG: hypothetical protein COU85_01110 [Candidatus Portnoybacteria bacterium CG10_big_fil_rev_8_21_14_0_10_44_7]|uniref:ATP-grasp domain-containing protein n=1 Tax=Candidatus Portnoybacteria bacterium CG10_big_fil_rev_8_21_14_0_10_44_7 TaxID=1974816 RepID=A0A2M8KJ25_9BACT|nr:MAG: hypothetical protein COU85_01110 [Candidatus Portnoybacteria bacterium CG10_big_fil_rev_8_21_14_0_10_44_7]